MYNTVAFTLVCTLEFSEELKKLSENMLGSHPQKSTFRRVSSSLVEFWSSMCKVRRERTEKLSYLDLAA